MGALRIVATACARLPGSTTLKKILDASWSATKGSIAYGIPIDALPFSNPYVLSGLARANLSHQRLSSMIYCSKLPFEVTGSAILWLAYWMLLSRLLMCGEPIRALVSIFKELMCGRIKMMTALCLPWAHTYQTVSLGCNPEQLRPEAFQLPKPKKKFLSCLPAELLPE